MQRSAGAGRSPITAYPGSPLIVLRLRRPGDRLVLVENHAGEAAALREAIGREKRVTVLEQDGYATLKAQLPPSERRGLVLLDPPYESETEFDDLLAALALAHERWPTGTYCVWYPQSERAGSLRFRRELRETGIRRILDAQLSRAATRRGGRHAGLRARDRQPAVAARPEPEGLLPASASAAGRRWRGRRDGGVAGAGMNLRPAAPSSQPGG